MARRLDISSDDGIFDALRQIRRQCEIRAHAARDAGFYERGEDWGYLAGRLDEAMEALEHLTE